MRNGIPYSPIQGQGQARVALKVRNSSISSISSPIFNGSWQMTADSLTRGQYLNLKLLTYLLI